MAAGRRLRITILTAGHLSTCPRMLKAADALHDDGHDLRVISTAHEPWAVAADAHLRSTRHYPVHTVEYRRGSGAAYWWTGVRQRAARMLTDAAGPDRLPFGLVARSYSRVHSELVAAALAEPADVVYGGTTGALAAAAVAGRARLVPFGVDLEDFHRAETAGPDAAALGAAAARIEADVLQHAAFVTTSSEAIAEAYRRSCGIDAATIHNVFPLPPSTPRFDRDDPGRLRVYWFSQTVGPGRGLEHAVEALGKAAAPAELTIRGRPHGSYLADLIAFAARAAPLTSVVHHGPALPDAMVELARGYDVGLALEESTPLNRQLCLPNKAFTYILAGVPVVLSDSPGMRPFGEDLGDGAALVRSGDVDALAAVFARWMREPRRLECAKRAAWNGAVRRWRWDHPLESGRLRELVRGAAR